MSLTIRKHKRKFHSITLLVISILITTLSEVFLRHQSLQEYQSESVNISCLHANKHLLKKKKKPPKANISSLDPRRKNLTLKWAKYSNYVQHDGRNKVQYLRGGGQDWWKKTLPTILRDNSIHSEMYDLLSISRKMKESLYLKDMSRRSETMDSRIRLHYRCFTVFQVLNHCSTLLPTNKKTIV